jgi:hypothetical protein
MKQIKNWNLQHMYKIILTKTTLIYLKQIFFRILTTSSQFLELRRSKVQIFERGQIFAQKQDKGEFENIYTHSSKMKI